ncbi:MAG: cupin domain-containing protein [Rugosibacter sp.]|jgi:mannose-6-phosphate isomerase-like protein (cupin superfamily)
MSEHAWQVFNLEDLQKNVEGKEPRFMEFLRTSQMSCAMYHLPAGALDMQAPHLEDEIYIVIGGLARLRMGDGEREVRPGMVLFVSATIEHSFFDIEKDLTLLAIFGPAPLFLEAMREGSTC